MTTNSTPCAVCNGTGMVGIPGAPCPFCKLTTPPAVAEPLSERTEREPLELAIRFHEVYERLAPSFGYETRPDTREFDPDSKNGRLMVAVCGELLAARALPVRQGDTDE